ncbi:MAG: alpha/beta fold hydrolase [Chloroflexi bacterium]|nr:alpha/beta fold hydrolase [Chloroflexota bacterium]
MKIQKHVAATGIVALFIAILALVPMLISCSSPAGAAQPDRTVTSDYEIIHTSIQQPVDHNNLSGASFSEEVNILIPKGAADSSPVFFILGNEHDITVKELAKFYKDYGSPRDVIFLQAEHRGYGQSITADADQSVPSYVTIDQALADYDSVVQKFKQKYSGPWMAAGHSYGGGLVINFAVSYPDDVKVILSSSGVVDWPFTMDTYDRQVRITMGDETYQRLVAHIKNLEPQQLFDQNWMEREFLIAFIHGMTQYGQYKPLLPVFKAFAALPTPSSLGVLHFLDDAVAQKGGWMYAASNAKKTLTHDEAVTGKYGWRVWRYQQCAETGIFEVSAQPGGVFTRSKDDFMAESRALFGSDPKSATAAAWSPRAMLDTLKVPMIYVGGGMDPWLGLGLAKDYVIKSGRYFYVPDGQHCPDRDDVTLGKQVLAEMLKYAGPGK